ncbi:CBS domain-containing protein [Metallosphaera hakonensis]|uniref:CBS domain-containing protein n=1 Tax=Metallosphaera hakonensis JCM 8857 = DSM 7519 TaxID=1293036 RepID=A0A2U9ITB4_9CREN|nr:CBS domain-containing protein [Metallosphaera hakonensis]AWR99276.1 CBS domain-containing protein [Metallosphaera hakonensis JCM 8857 = DSM 7519]
MEEIVKDYMKTEVISVEKGVTLRQVTKIMTEKNVGSVIITEKGKPIGIVTERDVVRAIGSDKNLEDKVDDIMTASLITVREDSPITGALSLMRTYNIRHLPVVNGDGKLTGIISIRDVAKALDDMFES